MVNIFRVLHGSTTKNGRYPLDLGHCTTLVACKCSDLVSLAMLAGGGRVLASTSASNVFAYYTDHGAPGYVTGLRHRATSPGYVTCVTFPSRVASKSHIIKHGPLFQNGAKHRFEMCFAPKHQGHWVKNTSRIHTKEVQPHVYRPYVYRPCTPRTAAVPW